VNLLLPLRLVALMAFIFLPGAWISFGLPLPGIPCWTKLALAMVLTPLVVAVEFYVLRLLGASFQLTVGLIVIGNLPALVLILRQRRAFSLPAPTTLAIAGFVFLVIVVCLAPFLLDAQKRLYTWEAWMHADIIYSLANGNLVLQDPDLAGVILSYPWIGQIYQGIYSYLIDTPPVVNYIWLNLAWLLAMFAFSAGIVAELGGNALSQVTVPVWLCFGSNFVGYGLHKVIPVSWSDAFHVLRYIDGDNRYTPWLDPIIAFSQMYFGLGLFIAIVYLVVVRWPEHHRPAYLVLAALLLGGLGLVYSVLLPAAMAVVGARVLILIEATWRERRTGPFKESLSWIGILLIVSLLTFALVKFLSQDRTQASLVQLNDLEFMKYESFITIVILSPLLLCLVLCTLRFWKTNREALVTLGIGALASCAMYVVFDIPWWRNEYKFVFTAAMCLAPFASLASEPILKRLGKFSLPAFALLTLGLALPFAYKVYYRGDYYYTRPGPLADISHFDLRLDDREPLSGLLDTIRDKTPLNALLVLENTAVHFPTLTQRQLYVAPAEDQPKPGILVTNDVLLTLIKGYPQQLVDARRATVRALFDSNDPVEMAQAMQVLTSLKRPLALVLDQKSQRGLVGWLTTKGIGSSLYQGDGLVVWLIQPAAGSLAN
jgi:hypothetical protein